MTHHPHTLYSASAGSGKTFTITSAYIARLIEGEDPGAILATTFTRAAAGEILQRVLLRLARAATDPDQLEELTQQVNAHSARRHTLTSGQCAAALRDIVDQTHRLSIQTIDAFFGSLATAFTFELGLAPTWRMVEEHEEDRLRERAIEQALEHADTEETLALLRELHAGAPSAYVLRSLLDQTRRAHDVFLAADQDEAAFDWMSPKGVKLNEQEVLHAKELLDQYEIPVSPRSNKPYKSLRTAIDKRVDAFLNNNWDKFFSSTLMESIMDGRTRGDHEYDNYNKNIPVTHELATLFEPLISHAAHALTAEHAARTRATFRLLERFDRFFLYTKLQSGALSFADPPRLLRRSNVTSDLNPIYYRLDATLRHVMLDEFQDTSTEQFTLLEPILDELLTQDTDARSVMIVGDEKQSLYAWRGAEPKLMGALNDRWPTIHKEILDKSYRSGPAVLDAVNQIFLAVHDSPALTTEPNARSAAARWADFPEHEAAKPNKPSAATLAVADEPLDHENDTDALLRSCATQLRWIRDAHPDESAAILVRKTKHIPALLRLLDDLGIKASEDRGNPLLDTPCVAAAHALLTWALYPNTTAALAFVAHSPLGAGLNLDADAPNERVRRRVLEHAARGAIPEFLLALLPHVAPHTDRRGLERYIQLTELAHTAQAAAPGDTPHLLRAIESTRVEEPGTAPVKVMTIHKSKGLEFDHVVLPLTDERWAIRNTATLADRDTDNTLGPITRVSPYANSTLRLLDPDLAQLHGSMLEKQINEELCCLYVATTRAATSLTMLVPPIDLSKEHKSASATHTAAHVVTHALAPDTDADTEHAQTLWTSPHNTGRPRSQRPTVTEASDPLTLPAASASAPGTARLTLATPSSLATHPAPNPFRARTRRAAMLGELVHAAFEHLEWITPDTNPGSMLANVPNTETDTDLLNDARDHLERALANPDIRDLLTEPPNTTTRVLNEHPFAARAHAAGSPAIVQGRIDRLVLTLDDDDAVTHAHVIDFKTGTADNDDTNTPQMHAYAHAAAKIYALNPGAVHATIVRTSPPSVTDITPPDPAP